MDQHKYAEARQLFEGLLPQQLGLKSQNPELLRIRGDFWARTGDWERAVTDFSALVKVEPDNHEGYFSLAPLLLQTGDVAGYRQLCHQILTRFAAITNDSNLAHRMGKVCLLLPSSGPEFALATSLADWSAILGKDRVNEGWCQITKGLAEYRRGRYEGAADWMQKVQAQNITRAHQNVQSYAVLAMARHQLKRPEAQTALAIAENIIHREMPSLRNGHLGAWQDWLIACELMREATALINGPTVTLKLPIDDAATAHSTSANAVPTH
jgi:tetratricopeptide (TPR) repeat protein